MILSYDFSQFLQYSCFEVRESIAVFPTELQCLNDSGRIQVNFRFKRFLEVLMIFSYEFPQFL